MAPFLPIVALTRSQKVRIGQQMLDELSGPTYVDLGDGTVRRDLQRHGAIGAWVAIGPALSDLDILYGLFVTADGTDLVLTVSPGVVDPFRSH